MVAIRPDLRSYSRVSYQGKFLETLMEQSNAHGHPGRLPGSGKKLHGPYIPMQKCWCGMDTTRKPEWYMKAFCRKTQLSFAIAGLGKLAIKAKWFQWSRVQIERCNWHIVPGSRLLCNVGQFVQKQKKQHSAKNWKKKSWLCWKMIPNQVITWIWNMLMCTMNCSAIQNCTSIQPKELKKRPLNIDVNRTIAMLEVEGMDLKNARFALSSCNNYNPNIGQPELIKAKI